MLRSVNICLTLDSTRKIVLTFIEVEEILGRELPATARNHRQWWENQESSPQAGQWQRAGFKTSPVEMHDETVRFYRDGSIAPGLARAQ